MAMTWTVREKFVIGDRQMVLAVGTFDSSYAAGGESITPSDFQLKTIDGVYPSMPTVAQVALSGVWWDRANSKLMVVEEDGTDEGAATDLSTTTVEVMVIGI